jgi:hypothetical protein
MIFPRYFNWWPRFDGSGESQFEGRTKPGWLVNASTDTLAGSKGEGTGPMRRSDAP